MRPIFFAAGLVLAAHTAGAETTDLTPDTISTHVVLENGCVYVENSFAPDSEWTLLYSQTGTPGQCALTIYDTAAPVELAALDLVAPAIETAAVVPPVVSRAQIEPIASPPKRLRKPVLKYMVGTFR